MPCESVVTVDIQTTFAVLSRLHSAPLPLRPEFHGTGLDAIDSRDALPEQALKLLRRP